VLSIVCLAAATLPQAIAHGAEVATPTYALSATHSTIIFNPPAPLPNPQRPGSEFTFATSGFRDYAIGDFNADGLTDLVLVPSYGGYKPKLPIHFWINVGNGAFEDQTANVIDGPVPEIGIGINLFVADFNRDGRSDLFIVDSGLEDRTDGYDGGINHVVLSQPDGRLKDVTATSLLVNVVSFNHVSSMSDVNGDGALDIVLQRLGGPKMPGSGLLFLFNDGNGRFTESVRGLSADIVYVLKAVPLGPDRQSNGSNGSFDVNGDGRVDLITASYNLAFFPRTVRFHQQMPNGDFIERLRVPIPAAIADIAYTGGPRQPNGPGLGAAGVFGADLNGDNRPDVIVNWEGAGITYIQMLRNDGAFKFTDVTLDWFGTYETTYPVRNGARAFGGFELRDVSGDGIVDLVPMTQGAFEPSMLMGGGFAFVNDGTGHFQRLAYTTSNPSTTAADLSRALNCTGFCTYRPFVFDATGDGQADLVLVDTFSLRTTDAPYREDKVLIHTLAGRYGTSLSPSFSQARAVGTLVRFTDTSRGRARSWLWSFGDGDTSSLQNPLHFYRAPGAYQVELSVSDGTLSETATQAVAVTPAP
jgi:hypothetical protein